MAELAITGKNIKAGEKIRVYFLKNGVSSKGTPWQFFTFKDNKKNRETGEYECLQQYTIFINNTQKNLKDGDYITVKRINSVQVQITTWNGIQYKKITLSCEVEDITQKNNEPNFESGNNQQENPFDDSYADDYNFGF